MTTQMSAQRTTVPDTIDITLYYWGTYRWLTEELKPESIRFHIIGKSIGSNRWRPHLIQHRDPLPIQEKKDFNIMLEVLQTSISANNNLECVTITKDLLDDASGE